MIKPNKMSEQKEDPKEGQQQTGEQSGAPAAPAPSQQQEPQEVESVTIDVPQRQGQNEQEQPPPAPGFRSTFSKYKAGLLQRPIKYDVISIVFTLLILGGGIFAYVTKESTASLVAGVVCGILLAFGTYFEGSRKNPFPLLLVLLFILGGFAYRYYKTMKFMPSGLFAIITTLMVARNCYLIHLKRQRSTAAS